jgi:hypothetical protein
MAAALVISGWSVISGWGGAVRLRGVLARARRLAYSWIT